MNQVLGLPICKANKRVMKSQISPHATRGGDLDFVSYQIILQNTSQLQELPQQLCKVLNTDHFIFFNEQGAI